MRALLSADDLQVDGFLCPGHVAVILGAAAFDPIASEYHKPCVIAGFEGAQIATALARLTEMMADGICRLENFYSQAVTEKGNVAAQELVARIFRPDASYWRGLALLPDSGLVLREQYRRYDARLRFQLGQPINREISGCLCGDVITGRATPADCRLFGSACTPARAIGPCMVSSEGTCQAWFKYKRVANRPSPSPRPSPGVPGEGEKFSAAAERNA